MKYCRKCVMPGTRPGIKFTNDGICSACMAYEKRKAIDWDARFSELEQLCDTHRSSDGRNQYDCMIAVSGGKDSHFQVHLLKEVLNMNPILVSVEDNFPMTEAGVHNLKNISEEFGCSIISLKPDRRAQKRVMRKTFLNYGKPNYYIDRLIYTYPLRMASYFNIPLLVYGENVDYEYGGDQSEETYSAREQVNNNVAAEVPLSDLVDDVVTENDLCLCLPPSREELNKLESVYLSYFVKWNSYHHYLFAKKRGFRDLSHEWKREGQIQDYDQVDSRAYLVHPWLKYPKFGHASATDYASKLIRYGLLSREEGVMLVKEHDHKFDSLALSDFLDFTGFSYKEFWSIVDSMYNENIFEKDSQGEWHLINPLWESKM